MKKKILTLLLTLVMVLALLPAAALAAPQSSYTSPSGITVNVTPAPAVLARADHNGEGVFVTRDYVDGSYVYHFYDVNGSLLGTGTGYNMHGYFFQNGRCLVSAYDPYTAETAYGYIDRTGKLVIPAQFKNAGNFSDGLARVSKDGNNWMYIDTAGNRAISQDFSKIYDFYEGVALVEVPIECQKPSYHTSECHRLFIDKSGNTIYEFPRERDEDEIRGWSMVDTIGLGAYVTGDDSYGNFNHGWMFVKESRGSQTYLMDKNGTLRAIPDLDGATLSTYLGDDILLVNKHSRSATIKLDGTMLMPYLYAWNELDGSFDRGVSVFGDVGSKGIVDLYGNVVVPSDWSGSVLNSIDRMVDGMAIGSYYERSTEVPYFFWVSDCPYAPGATAQQPQTPTQPEPSKPTQPATGFTDVPSWAKKAVDWALDKKITNGTSATTFSPNDPCTRAHILTFLYRAEGEHAVTKANPFTDVKESDYYHKAAIWAAEQGLISGDKLDPGAPCTRATVVTYLWKLAGSPSVAYNNSFTDVAANAEYAQAVAWAVSKNITNGMSDTTFAPNGSCTRGQIATFLYRAYH